LPHIGTIIAEYFVGALTRLYQKPQDVRNKMPELSAITNTGAMVSKTYMEKNQRMASIATQELASGVTVSDPSLRPSEAAIGKVLETKIQTLAQATKNASQFVAMIQMATGTLETTSNILARMKTLAAQAGGPLDASQRGMLQQEYTQLITEVDNLAQYTRWGTQQLFNGAGSTVTNSGVVAQAITGLTAVNNAFATTVANTQGVIDGVATDATVVANGSQYDVSVSIGGKTFKGTVAAPVGAATITLVNTTDSTSTIGFTYAAAVTAITNAATFQSSLRTLLGVGTGAPAVANSGSIAMYTNVTVAAGAATKSDTWGLKYTLSGTTGTFRISNGKGEIYTATATASASMTGTVTFNNGTTLTLSAFDGSASLGQTTYSVANTSTLTMTGQIETNATDTVSINFGSATASMLGITGTTITDTTSAATASSAVDAAANTINNYIAYLGGKRSLLDYQIDNLKISQQNQAAAKSTYTDTNIAEATERLTRFKALQQMSGSVFSQAIQDTRMLSDLLRNI
jgi:flagellin